MNQSNILLLFFIHLSLFTNELQDPFTYLLVISTASSVCWLLMPFAFILYFLMTYGSFLCILDISPFSVLKLASNFQVISPNLLTVNHVCGVL